MYIFVSEHHKFHRVPLYVREDTHLYSWHLQQWDTEIQTIQTKIVNFGVNCPFRACTKGHKNVLKHSDTGSMTLTILLIADVSPAVPEACEVIQLIRFTFITCCSGRNWCRCPTRLTENMFIMSAGRGPSTTITPHTLPRIETLCAVAEWGDTQGQENTYSTVTHEHTHTWPHVCTPVHSHTHTFTRSDTPARLMCSGGGAASVGMRRWTAFEPTTSVTHPYWWRTESSLTAQRFSGHSVAPGTAGISGRGRCGVAGGWMNGGLDRQVQNITSQVYLWNKPRESEKYELANVFGGVLNGVTSN